MPWYHCCQRQSGIFAVALLSSHRCRLGAGVVAVVAMACCCRRSDVVILLCRPGAGATIEASLLPLPLRCCHHCSCGAGVLTDIATTPSPPSLGNCCRRGAGILVALALLPLLLGIVLASSHVAMGIITILALVPFSCRAGIIVAVAVLASLLCWRLCCAGTIAIIAWTLLPLR